MQHPALRILPSLLATTLLALAAPADDITVLVVEDDESGALPTPLVGAVVTLQGTDPSSVTGAVLTTGPGGTVTFTGVTGPYSVTAQIDYVLPGETIRAALSVVDISPVVSGVPASGTIGLFLDKEVATPVTSFATLSGTILSPPTLTGSQIIEVVAVENGGEDVVGWADGSSGSYVMSIPAGMVVDCYAAHRQFYGSSPVISSVIATGVGPVAPYGAAVQNFNFASAVPWNVPVTVSESGRVANFDLGIQLLVTDPAAGVDFDFSIFDGPNNPVTIMLPSVAALAPFRVELDADARPNYYATVDGEQTRSFVLTTTPASVPFDFMPLPTMIQPQDGDDLSVSELACLGVAFNEGAPPAGFGTNGLNVFFLENLSGTPPPGIDTASWNILAPGGVQTIDVPAHARPMFAAGQDLYSGVAQFRIQGYSLGFEAFFDGNIAANLVALRTTPTQVCDSEVEIDLYLESDSYCTAGVSASGCQANLSAFGGASASAPSGFVIAAAFVEGNKDGLFFFGTGGRQAAPWGNGTSYQCVVPPVKRGGLLLGIGTSGLCDGVFAQDLNVLFAAKPPKNPGPGVLVQAQLWYRDPFNTSNQTTSFSNAIEFCVGP